MSFGPASPTWRPLAMGRHGALASNHPAATEAGALILRAGGNAADAAVATALALGVVEPHMSGLGGDGFYHHYSAATSVSRVYNGTGAAPLAAHPALFAATGMPHGGARSVSTPGALGGLMLMQERHGRLPLAELFAPAITLATEGFSVTRTYQRNAEKFAALLAGDARAAGIFLRAGGAPAPGTVLRQPELAATLHQLASEGAAALYAGEIGARITAALRDQGGLLARDDLSRFQPLDEAPLVSRYRGIELRQSGFNSTGFVLQLMLRIIEGFDLTAFELQSAELVHLLIEAKKLAFLERETVGWDNAPARIGAILSDENVARLRQMIDPERAAERPIATPETTGNTSYFCVADAEGNAVSAIQSLNVPFGSGMVAGDTGILLNNRMANWHLAEGHPNRLVPGRRVRHTMNAPMLVQDGRFLAALGTPGADDQVQVNLQAIVALTDFGLDPQQVVELPRWTSSQIGQSAKWPHAGGRTVTLEANWPAEMPERLAGFGHQTGSVATLAGPGALNILARLGEDSYAVAADPRRDGWAEAIRLR